MFRNMEYIYAVYRERSFSAAAKALYVSQPCLSAMVKKTEQKLGVPIFDRNTKPLQLTEYGVRYIAYLEKMRDLEEEFEKYLNDAQGLRTGSLSIGTNNVFASFVLPPLIRHFNHRYPGVKVKMVEGNIAYLEDALKQGALDLVLDNCPMDAAVCKQYQLGTEQLLLAAPKSIHDVEAYNSFCLTHKDVLADRHLLPQTPALPVEAFADIPFIALRPGNDTRIRMDVIYNQAGIVPNIQLEVDQLATAYNIACNGLGVTLVSDTLLRKTAFYPDMCYYKLSSLHTTRAIYLYHKSARYVTKAMQEFMDTAAASLAIGITEH